MTNDPLQVLLTVHEAARLIGKSESSVRAMVARHQVPVRRMGRRVFLEKSALLATIY